VRYHDKSIHLTQREFAVLHCLSSHNGRPVCAEDLLTFVWGEANPQDRSRQILEVYIHQLRQKLERLGLKGAVSTVRGFGYVLAHVSGEASAI
jgi:DNA-binding response OmpR family regulator